MPWDGYWETDYFGHFHWRDWLPGRLLLEGFLQQQARPPCEFYCWALSWWVRMCPVHLNSVYLYPFFQKGSQLRQAFLLSLRTQWQVFFSNHDITLLPWLTIEQIPIPVNSEWERLYLWTVTTLVAFTIPEYNTVDLVWNRMENGIPW